MIPDDIKEQLRKTYNIPKPKPLKYIPERESPTNDSEYPSTKDFIINPHIGAGVLVLGMTPDEIQKVLDFYPKKFRRYKEEVESENYGFCFIYYKKPNLCEAMEFTCPATVSFIGKNLLDIPYNEALEFVKKYDSDLQCDLDGFKSYKFGFGVYAPVAFMEPQEPVQSVIVFEKGYYDNEIDKMRV